MPGSDEPFRAGTAGGPFRVALIVAYDGTGLEGWQTQPHRRTVQDLLEQALSSIAREPIATTCAGRTDAGVHASRQVVHFDTQAARPLSAWVRGANAYLPATIAVRAAIGVAPDFHARFGALRRRYRYLLHVAPVRQPLLSGRVGWTHRRLDLQAMRAAAAPLVGEHDFSAFRSAQCQAASPVRRLETLSIEAMTHRFAQGWRAALDPLAEQLFCLDFTGNAFLHHMIRNIVGALVMVGSGQREPAWVEQLLASRDRRLGAPTFAATGLCFEGVQYDDRFGLNSWAEDGEDLP
jgi:tRNA pseudouridine38-40 synthase